jgi:predicted SAM-dependent methyltransferase
MTKLSFKRKITDYTKVRLAISMLAHGKKMFIKSNHIKNLEYLDIGCGPNTNEDFINLDYLWSSEIDVTWDLTKNDLPFTDNSLKGVFSEHCFEHIPLESFKKTMKSIFRILKKDGTLRIVVPDGEIYIDAYVKKRNGENVKMPYEGGAMTDMHRINQIFRDHGHQFIYDFYTIKLILEEIGFNNVRKEKYKIGRDNKLLLDTEFRAIESLYVEASK